MRFLSGGKSFQPPAVHQKQIEPAVVVIVVEGEAAAGGFEQIFVGAFAAVDGLDVETGLLHHLDKADAQRRAFDGRLRAGRRRRGLRVVAALLRPDALRLFVVRPAVARARPARRYPRRAEPAPCG